VSVKNIRPKYKNLKEWMEDKDNIYIGRKGVVFIDNERYPKFDSPFANPFKIKKRGKGDEQEQEKEQEKEREIVLKKYQKYILNLLDNDEKLLNQLISMKGKTLGCWCCPKKCHGDVLIEIINEITE
jgi:hypothetical protein